MAETNVHATRLAKVVFCVAVLGGLASCGGGESPAADGPCRSAIDTEAVAEVVEVEKAPAEAPSGAPNIVLVMTDDQHWQSIDCMPILQERVVANGVTFDNAFVTSPNCCPARAGFLTGDYVADHGVYTNGQPRGGADAFAPDTTVTELLKGAGYRTGLFGKFLTNYGSDINGPPAGFDDYLTFDRTSVPGALRNPATQNYFDWTGTDNGVVSTFGSSPAEYSTDLFGQRAIEFIVGAAGESPFFLQYSPYAPHRPATPATRHATVSGEVERSTFPPNYGNPPEGQVWDNELSDGQWKSYRRSEVEQVRADQIASLQSVDENIGWLLDQLAETGELDNTVVIFTSDNGFAWGEHRWLHKLCPYEACLRVPLVVADFRVGGARGIDSRIVTNLDIAATIADLAGLAAADLTTSGSPIDFKSNDPLRDSFLIENYGAGNGAQPLGLPPFQGVRTSTHKYVRYPDGAEEFFDLVDDPWELVNAVGDDSQREVLQDLRAETLAQFPRLLQQLNWDATILDGCLGDGNPITLQLAADLPPPEDVLSLEVLWKVDRLLDDNARKGLDLVSPGVGWSSDQEIALPPRSKVNGDLSLPAKQVWVQRLQTTQITELEIEATVEPADKVCVDGPVTIRAHILAPASGS